MYLSHCCGFHGGNPMIDYGGDIFPWEKGNNQWEYYKHIIPIVARPRFRFMDYIGVNDKNGTEIYEGDIYNYDSHGLWENSHDYIKGLVKWDEGAFWGFENNERNGLFYSYQSNSCIEVIGNIYENPELLKGDLK